MKKIIIISTLLFAAIALMSVGFNRNQTDVKDLVYKVDSRFNNTVAESVLQEATSIVDLIPDHSTRNQVTTYKDVQISLWDEANKITAKGEGSILNEHQIALLKAAKSSENILLEAKFNIENMPSDYGLAYYMTVLPTAEAEYVEGHDALIKYLKDGSSSFVKSIKKEKLKPGQFTFTVTQNGQVDKVETEASSGYHKVDKKLVELIKNIPGTWTPAQNAKGDRVDQKLIFFFGMQGC